MCKPYSFVAVRFPGSDTPKFIDSFRGVDNHTSILEENRISAKGESLCDIAKLEYDMYSDAPTLVIDEDTRPRWFDSAWESEAIVYAKRRRATFRTLSGKVESITEGNWIVRGKCEIDTVSGGDVRSLNTSSMKIDTVSGGDVRSLSTSSMKIDTVSGGDVRSLNTSSMEIDTMSGGNVWSESTSSMKIGKDLR